VSETGRPKAVVCLSGGMDSTVCAALAAKKYDAYGLHFSYGQRTEARELQSGGGGGAGGGGVGVVGVGCGRELGEARR
jgi:7-cyano-7-deazaguanine synthase